MWDPSKNEVRAWKGARVYWGLPIGSVDGCGDPGRMAGMIVWICSEGGVSM